MTWKRIAQAAGGLISILSLPLAFLAWQSSQQQYRLSYSDFGQPLMSEALSAFPFKLRDRICDLRGASVVRLKVWNSGNQPLTPQVAPRDIQVLFPNVTMVDSVRITFSNTRDPITIGGCTRSVCTVRVPSLYPGMGFTLEALVRSPSGQADARASYAVPSIVEARESVAFGGEFEQYWLALFLPLALTVLYVAATYLDVKHMRKRYAAAGGATRAR